MRHASVLILPKPAISSSSNDWMIWGVDRNKQNYCASVARKHISPQIALWFVACQVKILRLVVMHDIRTGEGSHHT